MSVDVCPDERALRSGRRRRVLDQMAAHDLDVLVLGRQANVRYVTGTPQLWVAGTRPFGPSCVLVRATGAVHLLSTWDEGVPDDIPHENLYGISWNPANTMAVLRRIDGAATARRVGTDALSPAFAQLLPTAFPNATLVDGELAMRAARRIKTAEEVAAVREAIAKAESGLAAAVAELHPGVREQTLAGVMLEAMAGGGVATPANQEFAWVTSRDHPWRRVGGDGRVHDGDLVAFSAGVLAGGYMGEVGRTWPAGAAGNAGPLRRRSERLWDSLLAACRPGGGADELLAAYQAAWLTSQGRLAEREVALAKQRCGEAYKFATLTAHQLHGGMGYMREFDLHLWSERAKASELLGGPAAVQSRRLERAMSLVG